MQKIGFAAVYSCFFVLRECYRNQVLFCKFCWKDRNNQTALCGMENIQIQYHISVLRFLEKLHVYEHTTSMIKGRAVYIYILHCSKLTIDQLDIITNMKSKTFKGRPISEQTLLVSVQYASASPLISINPILDHSRFHELSKPGVLCGSYSQGKTQSLDVSLFEFAPDCYSVMGLEHEKIRIRYVLIQQCQQSQTLK